jgi:hypothetical protein
VVSGTAWDVAADGKAQTRVSFWATLESAPAALHTTVDLNRVGVAELEAIGFSPRSARTIVHGRLMAPFKDMAEATEAPGLSAAEKTLLAKRGVVK